MGACVWDGGGVNLGGRVGGVTWEVIFIERPEGGERPNRARM